MEHVDVVIIGAGVVGLAIAAAISRPNREMYILEKGIHYGQETSSHNSEVVHAGIYYPKNSLKANLCTRGRELIYQLCRDNNIAFKILGKLIVATQENEVHRLEDLLKQGIANGVGDLVMLDEDQIHDLEPQVRAITAIYSPSTGIVDTHGLMAHFYREARRKSGFDPLVLNTEVVGVDHSKTGYVIETKTDDEIFSVISPIVINAAGLYADRIAEMVGIDIDSAEYRIHWCKGDYFSLTGKPPVQILVYPAPPTELSLGIHTVPDLVGRLRFGPNAYYVDEINYRVESNLDDFWQDIYRYLPSVSKASLSPDMTGIRPKLQKPGDPFRDFIIKHEDDRGFSGLINLIGIESPGLTCAPAIAERVSTLVDELLP
jgi:L-2-hydroxyglutarate oxidase LhgO